MSKQNKKGAGPRWLRKAGLSRWLGEQITGEQLLSRQEAGKPGMAHSGADSLFWEEGVGRRHPGRGWKTEGSLSEKANATSTGESRR